MDNRTKNDINRAMNQIDDIVRDLNINIMLCEISEINHYESLINDLLSLQGDQAVGGEG